MRFGHKLLIARGKFQACAAGGPGPIAAGVAVTRPWIACGFRQVSLPEINKVEILSNVVSGQAGARLSQHTVRRIHAGLQPGDLRLRPLRLAWHPVRVCLER